MIVNEMLDMLWGILNTTGILNFSWKFLIMWGISGFFLYLAIAKNFEPLLLLPIGFGIFHCQFPVGAAHGVLRIGHARVATSVLPIWP